MIGNGRGLMPAYRRIPAMDRWYLVAYVRQLQAEAMAEEAAAAEAEAAAAEAAAAEAAAAEAAEETPGETGGTGSHVRRPVSDGRPTPSPRARR